MSTAHALGEDDVESSWFGEDVLELQGRAARSLAAAAAEAVGVKVFPAVAQRVLELLRDPEVTIGDLRTVIEQDAALASRLLRVANSPIYARGNPCRSIDEAVLRLGTNQVKSLVAGITAFGIFPAESEVAKAVRSHGAGVAAILGVLGSEWRQGYGGDLFLIGLLHDFGKLAAMQVGEIAYNAMPEDALSRPDGVHRLEREQSGYDHAALGATILHNWEFDRDVVQAIAWHHRPGRAYTDGGTVGVSVALLRLADAIDYQIRENKELDEAFVDELMQRGEASYAEISREQFIAMWPKLVAAHEEMQGLFID